MKLILPIFLLLLLNACSGSREVDAPPLFEALSAEVTGMTFENRVTNEDDLNIFNYRNFYNGGGVGIGDVNNDGLPDVFLTANMGPNKLYLNRGNWQFEDVSAAAGIELSDKWSTGVAMIDLNQDGWLDIYVCNAGFRREGDQRNNLFLNNQDGTFREAAADYGLDDGGYTTHAAFFDYDGDGDLDVYMLNNSFIPVSSLNFNNQRDRYADEWEVKEFLRGGGDKLLRNDGGNFTDVSREAGIYGSLIGFGLGVTVGDVNGDYRPDIYVSNDFYERDYLYVNQGDGTFSEEVEGRMGHLSLASMGTDLADLNNDRHPEIFATEMLPETDYRRKTTVQFENLNTYLLKQQRGFYHQYMHNTLQANNGDGTFSEIAQYAGVEATDWSWGALLFDADNDGLRDILVCNGIYHNLTSQDFIDFFANDVVQRMALTGKKEDIEKVIDKMPSEALPNKIFQNLGDFNFADRTDAWGLGTPSFSNGAAYGDLDGDGDLDLVINNVNQPLTVYRNRAERNENHHLTVVLRGPENNPFALGSTVELFRKTEVLRTEIIPTRGFQSSVDYPAVFGLGTAGGVDSLRVVWSDRTVSVHFPAAGDTSLTVAYQPGLPPFKDSAPASLAQNLRPLFEQTELSVLEAHREDDHQDQQNEGLLMRTLTREGPGSAVGDLNGDGQDDLIIAGARQQPTRVYLQENGQLVGSEQPALRQLSVTETTKLMLFDADGDDDLDLFMASGGNFDRPGSPFFQDQLLFNDGTGTFVIRPKQLPRTGVNTAVGVALDYDGDGDLDLFTGSRALPGNYGMAPASYLFENDGTGKFRDVTATVAPELQKLGMVTDGTWTDEGSLVVTTEWGAVRQFRYADGRLSETDHNLGDYRGWWYAVRAADLDGDGDQDLVLGNRGENFYFTGDAERPAKLFIADFDGNGTMDKIFAHRVDGRDLPLFMKRDLTAQLPGLKKQSLKHADYANKSVADLFGADKVANARVLEANYFRSAVAINQGDGQYVLRPLPAAAQFSSVHAIDVADLNGDQRPDLILGGNSSGYLPQFSRQDASYGQLLLNRGDAEFSVLPARRSGLSVRGDLRSWAWLTLGDQPHLIATVNDSAPRVFRFIPQETVQ